MDGSDEGMAKGIFDQPYLAGRSGVFDYWVRDIWLVVEYQLLT
jgi:hypothetical protein